MNKTDITYSIGAVSKITGIEKYKLRNWTDRYLTHIQKIEIGNTQHRRFTEKDINLIKKIKEYRRKGFTFEAAVENARKDLIDGKN
ncbi:MAG: MerR family transcriptional regulator [Desulfobacteraceae bacterium]|nr:MAG: MerR family transcriptional regulator [Desulfobacteraceae bacterium]